LRELRKKVTFALFSESEDINRVATIVDGLFSLLEKTAGSSRMSHGQPQGRIQALRVWMAQASSVCTLPECMCVPMRTKWASCSSSGILSFNVELLELEPKLWNYVIVHELLHFDVPNHGKLWKSLMRAHVGDWEQCERLLQKHAARQADGLQKLMLEWDHSFDLKAECSRKAAH
jgi:hypothetical protein